MNEKEKIVIGKNFKYDPNYVLPLEDAITVLSKYDSEKKRVTNLDDDLDIIIPLDTNFLLSYYQYSITDRTTLKEFYEKNTKKIYITNWVEKEFVSQFYGKIKGLKNQFENFNKEVNNNFNAILDNITKIEKHHYLNSEYLEKSEEIKKINEDIKLQIEKKKSIIDNIEYKEYEGIDNDKFLKLIKNIAKSEETTKEELDFIYNQYIEITKSGWVIPGAKKKDQQKGKFPHGDFIIFYELLKLSKQKEKDIIFITNDMSGNDWLDEKNNIYTTYLFNAYKLTNGHLIYILPASVIKAIPKLEEAWHIVKTTRAEAAAYLQARLGMPSNIITDELIIDKWENESRYLGTMSWKQAIVRAKAIGMRLPTVQEIQVAIESGLHKHWSEYDPEAGFWTSEEYLDNRAYLFLCNYGTSCIIDKDYGIGHVCCIR